MNITTERLTAEESKLLTKVMTMGSATALPVVMTPSELAKIIGIVYHDTDLSAKLEASRPGLWDKIKPGSDYYTIRDDWFTKPINLRALEHIDLMRVATEQIPDFVTYLRCLAELHKRRRKYAMILSAQPMPTMIQVSPRSLIEYGRTESEALASWLIWRKFFYDLDNRAAQETGYLFEPILAAAIGGEPKGARARVVRRSDDATKGRQVDCWKVVPNGKPLAYEFKLRVTIAASGQGRFGEELQFAQDCANSGVVPVLVVLDPTPNPRLSNLRTEFEARGGHAYVGTEAWQHLEQEAGDVMARFIERYVRAPVTQISAFETSVNGDLSKRRLQLLDFQAYASAGEVRIVLGDYERRIPRREDESLADDSEDGESAGEFS